MNLATSVLEADWIDKYNQGRQLWDKPFLSACYAPFLTLDFSPNGEVFVCCVNVSYSIGKIPKETIDDIWHGAKIQAIREALTRYDFSLDCQRCYWQVQLKNYSTVFAKRDDQFPISSDWDRWPLRMDFRLNNTCNFACIMCDGDYSSAIRARQGRPPFKKVYDDSFFVQLEEYIPRLRYAMFSGGEPFLVKEYERIWDLIIQLNPKIECVVNTNASILNDKVLYYLDKVHFVDIGVSFDGATKKTFEQIRQGSHFETVLSNLLHIKKDVSKKGRNVHLAVCVTRQNWQEFPQIVELAESLDCAVHVNLVHYPPDCSLYELPASELANVRETLEDHFQWSQGMIRQETLGHYQGLIESVKGAQEKLTQRPFAQKYVAPKI